MYRHADTHCHPIAYPANAIGISVADRSSHGDGDASAIANLHFWQQHRADGQ